MHGCSGGCVVESLCMVALGGHWLLRGGHALLVVAPGGDGYG